MRVLFLQDSAINESLALCDVSACLKQAGHETLLLLEDEEKDLAAAIKAWDAPMTLIPCHVTGHDVALRLARAAKRASPGTFIVFGGTHVTFEPELALAPEVDCVLVGEAEEAAVELANVLLAGGDWRSVRNVAYGHAGQLIENPLRPLVDDLDTLPPPDRELYFRYPFIARFGFKKFTTSRGCVHSCSFCWNTTLRDMYKGQPFTRRKSPARAVSEIASVTRRHPTTSIHFSDDLFAVFPSWLEEFAELYRDQVAVPFTCNTSVETVNDRTMGALALAGCRGVGFGIETSNEALREKILKKRVTNDHIREAADVIHRHGLELTTFNMLASPGETLEDGFNTIALNREIGVDHVRCNLAVPLPHTDFELKSMERGDLPDDYGDNRVASMEHPEVAFAHENASAWVNLWYMFRPAVHMPRLDPLVRRLVHLPTPQVLDMLRMWIPFEEKRIFRLGWWDGFRYFRHVGDPHKKTANYVTLI